MHARAFASLAIVTLFAASAAADEASHKVMDHWVGHWTETAAAANTNGPAAKPDQVEAAWTLDDNFVQGTTSTGAGKTTGVWLLSHDAKSGNYKVWFFSALGVGEWTGTWSDADNKMTWEGTQSPSGAKLTGYTKFTGDRQEWQVQVDDAGKVTTDSGSLERKK